MDLIRIKNVEKKYKNGVTAIYDLNLAIEKGSFVFVIGGSGSGKSTLIKMLYREEKPNSGTIKMGGINVCKLRNRNVYKLRRKLGIVFQDYRLLPKLTVYENVAFALEVTGEEGSVIRKKVVSVLEQVGLKSKFRTMLDTTGQPIKGTEIDALSKAYVDNGSWDKTKAEMIVGDFSNAVYSIRQDVTYKVLTEAVIQDPSDDSILYNLAQQDMVALRCVMRLGWEVPNPVNALDESETRFPFAAIIPDKSV